MGRPSSDEDEDEDEDEDAFVTVLVSDEVLSAVERWECVTDVGSDEVCDVVERSDSTSEVLVGRAVAVVSESDVWGSWSTVLITLASTVVCSSGSAVSRRFSGVGSLSLRTDVPSVLSSTSRSMFDCVEESPFPSRYWSTPDS